MSENNSSNAEPNKETEDTFKSLSDLDKVKYMNENMTNAIMIKLNIQDKRIAELLSNFIQTNLFHTDTDYQRNISANSFYNKLNFKQQDSIDNLAKNYYRLKEKTCIEYVGELIRENKDPEKKGYSIKRIITHIYKDILTGKLYEFEKKIGQMRKGGKKSRKIQKNSKRITYKK